MKYTYKREIFLYYPAYKARVILGSIIGGLGLFAIISAELSGLILFLPGALIALWGLSSGLKDYKNWNEYRKEWLEKGICCHGKVVDWGGHRYLDQETDYDDGVQYTFATRNSDWWIEVEYIDRNDGETKRFKAMNMNKKGEYLVGRRADVYLHKNQLYVNVM